MKSLLSKHAAWTVFVLLSMTAMAYCDDTKSIAPTDTELSQPSTTTTTSLSAKMGMETYLGVSNMAGERSYSDGMWAAAGTYYPSITYFQWDTPGGHVTKLSLGTGRLYMGSSGGPDQPAEAYWQAPVGRAVVTVGKFWVPFAQQEWLYESKPGIMAQWTGLRSSLTASANYNKNLRRPNMYIRGSYKVASDAELGLSFALGHGFCSDSVHDCGIAVDTTIGYAGWRFCGECNHFNAGEPGNAFNYRSGKLYYERLGAWAPFVAIYSWNDHGESFGRFRSTVYGLNYRVSPTLALEGGTSATSDGHVCWLQFHWTWERPISDAAVKPSRTRTALDAGGA